MQKILLLSLLLLTSCGFNKETVIEEESNKIETKNINDINDLNSGDISDKLDSLSGAPKDFYLLSGNSLVAKNDLIKENYKYIELSDKVIYYDNIDELQKFSTFGCNSNNEGEFNDCFSYQSDEIVLEIKNIVSRSGGFGARKGDVYYGGSLLVKDFNFGCRDGCVWPKFEVEKGILSVTEGRGDVCSGFSTYRQYNIKTQEFKSFSNFGNGCFVDESRYSFGNSEANIITMYSYKEEKGNPNKYSVFSIVKGDSRKNYLYNSELSFETNQDFLKAGNQIIYLLGGKEFKINYDDLEKSKYKMPFIYGGGGKTSNFDYLIYLKKHAKGYTIHFDKIDDTIMTSDKKVKNIGVISCKPGSPEEYDNEYILKTKDKNGNYKYNISESFENKCDLPYKINIYYEDGTVEYGEYYVLFDY